MFDTKSSYAVLVCMLISTSLFSVEITSKRSHQTTEVVKTWAKPQNDEKVKNIYFDTGDSGLNKESKRQLNKLIEILKYDTLLEVLVAVYTDSKNIQLSNKELALKRGEKIRAYILKKGIANNRIYLETFGEEQLTHNCGDSASCKRLLNGKDGRAEFIFFKD